MNNQLKTLAAALLMTVTLCSTQAFASVGKTSHHANTSLAAATTQNIQLAGAGWPMPPAGFDEDM